MNKRPCLLFTGNSEATSSLQGEKKKKKKPSALNYFFSTVVMNTFKEA